MVRYSLDGVPPYFGSIKELRARVMSDEAAEGRARIYADGRPYAHMARLTEGDKGYDMLMSKASTDTVYWRGSDDIPDVCSPVLPDGSIGRDVDLRTAPDGSIPDTVRDIKGVHLAMTEENGDCLSKGFLDISELRLWAKNSLLGREWVIGNPEVTEWALAPLVLCVNGRWAKAGTERVPKVKVEGIAVRTGLNDVIWGLDKAWRVIGPKGELGKSAAFPGRRGPTADEVFVQGEFKALSIDNGLSKRLPKGTKEMSEAEVNAYTKLRKVQSMEERMFKDPDLVKELARAVKRDLAKYPPEIVAEVVCDKGQRILEDAQRVLAGGKGSEYDSVFAFAASLEKEVIKRMEERGLELDGKVHDADEFIDLVDIAMVDRLKEIGASMDEKKNESESKGERVKAEKSKDNEKERADRLYGLNVLAHVYFNASAMESDLSSLEPVLDADRLEAVKKCAAELKAMLGKAYDEMFAEQLKKV